MRLTAPASEGTDRYAPIHLSDDDLDDLSTFTGLSKAECRRRVMAYSTDQLTEAWYRVKPQTPAELINFYRSSDLYIWDLTQWHASAEHDKYRHALQWFTANHPPHAFGRVYDFGCGIGTDALYLAARGYDVTAVDVGGPVLDFARHRFRRRGLSAQFVESHSAVPEISGQYDAIVCFDVFEHLPEPLAAARRLVSALRPGGVLLQRGGFGGSDERPYHLQSGIERYGGIKWHIHLTGLGLVSSHEMGYRKVSGASSLVPRSRFWLWRASGMWLSRVDRPGRRHVPVTARRDEGSHRALLDELAIMREPWRNPDGPLEPPVLEAIARHAASGEIAHSIETGTGKSTLLLSHLSRHHSVFTVGREADGNYQAVVSSQLLNRETTEFILGPSQETLPRHRFGHRIQLALLDGPHAFPFPELEYFFIYPHLDEGALLIIDDIHIPTLYRMFEFLRDDAMFQLVEVVGTTAFFRRTSAPLFPPTEDNWFTQGYNKARFPVRRLPGLSRIPSRFWAFSLG